jgi:hypothetical protein
MDWKEAGLNQDADILWFLVGKTLFVLSLDVVQAVYTQDYQSLMLKPVKLGSVLAYEIAYVRLNREVLNTSLEIKYGMNTKPLANSNTYVPDPSIACPTGFTKYFTHSTDPKNIFHWDVNSRDRQLNMGFYSGIVNSFFSTIDYYVALKGAGHVFRPEPPPTLTFLPVQAVLPAIVNPLYLAHQVPLPVAQYADPAPADNVLTGIQYGKLGVSGLSTVGLYAWLWYKNMKETSEFKCPPQEPPRTL